MICYLATIEDRPTHRSILRTALSSSLIFILLLLCLCLRRFCFSLLQYLVVFPFFVFSALMLWVKSAQPELPV